MINVLGDAYGAGIVEHLSKKDLAKADVAEQLRESNEYSGNGSPIYATPHKKSGATENGTPDNDTSFDESRMTTYC